MINGRGRGAWLGGNFLRRTASPPRVNSSHLHPLPHSPITHQHGVKTSVYTGKTPLQWLQTRNIKTTHTLNGHHSHRSINHPLSNLRRRPSHLHTHRTHPHRHLNTHNKSLPTNTANGHPTTQPLHHPRRRNTLLLPHPNTHLTPPLPLNAPPGSAAQRHPPPRSNLRRRRQTPRQRQHPPPHRSARLEPQNPTPKGNGDGAVRRQEESYAQRRWGGVWTQATEF